MFPGTSIARLDLCRSSQLRRSLSAGIRTFREGTGANVFVDATHSHMCSTHAAQHARGMIYTEHGLRFTKGGDSWRCVEHPDLVMLRGERRRVGERTFGSLHEALRHLEARGSARRQ